MSAEEGYSQWKGVGRGRGKGGVEENSEEGCVKCVRRMSGKNQEINR